MGNVERNVSCRGWVLLAAAAVLLASAPSAWAGTATVRWTHPDPDAVEGFLVHQRTLPDGVFDATDVYKPTPDYNGVYVVVIPVPDGIPVEVSVSAYNRTAGLTSEMSVRKNRIHFPGPPGQPTPVVP